MIKIEKVTIAGFEGAIRGMRNPKNSWDRTDTKIGPGNRGIFVDVGPKDKKLMKQLSDAGPVHGKYKRMIVVYADVTAPLYWWKEYDTYKVGTVANSCSTMHKLPAKAFTLDDFSCQKLGTFEDFRHLGIIAPTVDCSSVGDLSELHSPKSVLIITISMLNKCRELYLRTGDKYYWWQMIQLLPSSYNQKRTVMLNYEVLTNIYKYRNDHKLDEWIDFCKWIETLPMSEIITGGEKK